MRHCTAIVSVLILLMLGGDVSAQYFGKNKVQYRRHEFRVLQTEHFDIYFHQDRREAVDVVGRLAERWWRRLSRFFGYELTGRQPIVLYSSKPDFDQTLIVPGLIDGGTAGVTEGGRRRIALPFAPSLADTDHVLGHEIVHAFQFDQFLGAGPQGKGGEPQPLWVTEGLAEYLTLGAVETHTAMWLRDAVRNGALPRLADLAKPQFFPYRWGHAFWAYVGGRWGDIAVADLYRVASLYGMADAVETVLGITADDFEREWHEALRAAYPGGTSAAVGRHLAGARPLDGAINVGAALSPDGRWIAYLTERLFSVDLVVADAERGRVVATLTDTAANPRYSSLQYIGSGAAWDPRGERVAIATLTSGRAALSIFRWPGGALEQDVVVDGVDEIFGPTWSPDGATIAFSAMNNGTSDLFAFDLERGVLRRLTDDLYADLHPAWAPDGRRIAFVTDRFTTDLKALTPGAYRVALIDAATAAVEPVPAFTTGKHIAPQWSRDGGTLYFISDSDGTPDVYAIDLQNGALTRLTTADGGVSGLTGSSPALSIASGVDTAAVTVYEGGVFAIHLLALASGAPATAGGSQPRLPPTDATRPSIVLADDDAAPAPAEEFPVSPYRARLAIEDIAQVSLGAGVDPYGAMAGGGLGFTLSDMLHTHWLVAAVQMSSPFGSGFSLRDVAGSIGYLNQARRWNWGVFAHVIPTYVGVRTDTSGLLSSYTLVRQIERSVSAGATYPFSRARRLEVNASTARLAFDELSGFFGELSWKPAADPMTLGSVAAAFVSDTSYAGATSMVSGERYRLEVAPVFGSLQYFHVTADYRRYVMPVPFVTIAARALHIGRYGSGAEDARLPSLYLGYPWLVRGFDIGWHVNDCVAVLSAGCPELNDLLGSRLAVGNLELRLPLLRPLGLKRSMYGPIPAEVAAFVDGGVAWRGSPGLRRGPGAPAWSAGITLRTNLIGFGVGQLDIARPFSRPDEGWVVQFNLSPAF
ncbi:MAG TPA: hypothetical protein VM819_14745 [Vicinamibacterales bacterium]|nr:hypothetical protein [Vicinamibacterales bacterium]